MITFDVIYLQLIKLSRTLEKNNCFVTCIELSLMKNLNNFYIALKIYNIAG